jgi:hypothetical protein
MKRTLLLAAAVPLIVLPGVMSGTAAAAVPTAATSASPATSPVPPGDPTRTLKDFVGCLKDHGVDVPEPRPGTPLRIQAGPGEDAERAAIEACVPDLPAPSDVPPPGSVGNPEDFKEFSQCMRDHGLSDFPDPGEKGLVVERGDVGPDVHPGDPEFDSAQQACRGELPPGAADGPVVVGGHTAAGDPGAGPGTGPAVAIEVGVAEAPSSAPAPTATG